MSRIIPKPICAYPWHLRILFYFQKRKFGAIPEPMLLWGRTPSLLRSFMGMWRNLSRKSSRLSPVLRALICIRVSQINTCPFCIDLNTSFLLKNAHGEEKAAALKEFSSSHLFDEKEKTALKYAEEITKEKGTIDDKLFNLLRCHFSDDTLIELTALIAFQNMSSKFNKALEASPLGFCTLLKKKEI